MFAIVDIFSQSLLERFHGHLNTYLKQCFKRIDATFDQNAQVEKIREASETDMSFWSFDLDACTDRLPRSVMRDVLV
jgi:hypothetical protein